MNRNHNRKQWLDIAKGIAIILMVIGHTSIPNIASNFIYAFHMPLFFIASGLFFSVSCFNEHSFFKYSFVVIANASIFVESFELGFSTSAFIQAILCFFYPFSPVSE